MEHDPTPLIAAESERHRKSAPYVQMTLRQIRARMRRALKRADEKMLRLYTQEANAAWREQYRYCQAIRAMLRHVR